MAVVAVRGKERALRMRAGYLSGGGGGGQGVGYSLCTMYTLRAYQVAVEVKAFLDEGALYVVFIVGILLLSVSLVRVGARARASLRGAHRGRVAAIGQPPPRPSVAAAPAPALTRPSSPRSEHPLLRTT